MKRKILIASILLLLIVLPILAVWQLHRPVPSLDGNASIAGLQHVVTVEYDHHAVPYINANDDLDAYAAQGFVTARERMFQMDMLRRMASGEMSEVYGDSALPTDRLMRTIGIRRVALEERERISPAAKAALDAYARGVNSYLSANGGHLSLEFMLLGYAPRPWRAEDSLAVLKYLAYKADESWRLDDFRQRVAGKLGAQTATELFRDDLVAYGLPQQPEDQQAENQQSDKQGAQASNTQKGNSKTTASSKRSSTASTGNVGAAVQKPSTKSSTTKKTAPHSTGAYSTRYSAPAARGTDSGAGRIDGTNDTPQTTPAPLPPSTMLPQTEKLISSLAVFGDKAHAFDNPSPMFGSTSFAVPGTVTRSRGAMLACDKDGSFASPSDWFICFIESPGLRVAGATIPGVPGIMIGRNDNIGWGSANMKADVQDLFLERFGSQFDANYQTNGGTKAAETRDEIIPVRFGRDVQQRVYVTQHGPVLMRDNQAAVSLAWTGLNSDRPAFDALYKLNRASNWNEFVSALSNYSDPPQMFTYVDRWGNSGIQAAGDIPIRAGGTAGTMLNPGWLANGAWTSMIPFDSLPQAQQQFSAGGKTVAVAANQQPSDSPDALPMDSGNMSFGHQFLPAFRANRLLAAITNAKTPIALSDMNALQGDLYSALVPSATKALQDAAVQSTLIDKNSVKAINMLVHWDGQLRPDSVEASLYEAFIQTLGRRQVEPLLGRDMATEYLQRWPMWLTRVDRLLQDRQVSDLPPDERTFNTFVIDSLVQAMKSLRITFDTTHMQQWRWGKIHRVNFDLFGAQTGPWFSRYFRLGPVHVGGSAECVMSCDVNPDPAALSYAATTGPTQRLIIDMSDRDKFYEGVSTGQSGHMFSPHRADQLDSWVRNDLAPVAFSSDQMMKQAQHRLNLESE